MSWFDKVFDKTVDSFDHGQARALCSRLRKPRTVTGKTFDLPRHAGDWMSHLDSASGRVVTLFIEGPHYGDPDLAISTRSLLGWDPPHEREEMSDEDRTRIFEQIVRGYKAKGFDTFVVESRFSWLGSFARTPIVDVVSGRVLELTRLSLPSYKPDHPVPEFRLPKRWSTPDPKVPIDDETMRELRVHLRKYFTVED